MIAQPLRSAGAALLLDRLEHVRHVARVVAGARHDLRALEVGLLLVLAAEPQERRAEPELRALERRRRRQRAADDGAEDGAGNLPDCVLRGLGRLGRAVPQRDVAELVRHDAGDLAFGLRRLDHAAIDEHRSAGQRERVDLADVDDLERVAEPRVLLDPAGSRDQPPPDVLHVRRHLIVPHDRQLLLNLGGCLAAELDVLLDGILLFGRRYLGLRGQQRRQRQNAQRCGVQVGFQFGLHMGDVAAKSVPGLLAEQKAELRFAMLVLSKATCRSRSSSGARGALSFPVYTGPYVVARSRFAPAPPTRDNNKGGIKSRIRPPGTCSARPAGAKDGEPRSEPARGPRDAARRALKL